jgi:hypothetical protein
MAEQIVYIGDDVRFDFKAEERTASSAAAVPLPVGTKLWSGVKLAPASSDPPLLTKKNEAAGGSEQQARVTSVTGGLFSVYLETADTATLTDGKLYQVDGIVEIADGTRWTAGLLTFTAKHRVWRSPT